MISYCKLTELHLRLYADAIVRNFAPRDKEEASHDTRSNVYRRKAVELRSLIMSFSDDIDFLVKEEIANDASQRLIQTYKTIVSGILT